MGRAGLIRIRVPVSPRGAFGPRGYREEVSCTSEAVEKRNEALYGDEIRANLGDRGCVYLVERVML